MINFLDKIKLYIFVCKKFNFKKKEIILFENKNYDKLWSILLKQNKEKYYNFIISMQFCLKFLILDNNYTSFETEIYTDKNKIEIFFIMIKTVETVLQDSFNELIKTDLNIINRNDIWGTISLDSLYRITLPHIKINITDPLKKKKFYINISVSTLERLNGVYFYSKLVKREYPEDLINNISFTKGYLICFKPELVKILKNFKYVRKLIKKNPIEIIPLKKKMTFCESLENSNFSSSVWLNNNNINKLDSFEKIYNKKLLEKKQNVKIFLKSLNYLNSLELVWEKEKFNKIYNIISSNDEIHYTLSNRNFLEKNILRIGEEQESFLEIPNNINTLIQSAAVLELIKNQFSYYKTFYFDHNIDQRYRIYPLPWPINYQLNHIVRNSINFKEKKNIEEIWKKFLEHSIIKKYLMDINIFEYEEKIENIEFLENIFKKYNITSSSEIEEKFKKECIFQLLNRIVPKKYKKQKIEFIKEIFDDFLSCDIQKDWKIWLDKLEMKGKKMPYLVDYNENLKKNINNNFENLFWCDASSNAIQLITLRLGCLNEKLFELTNIFNNETEYSNIYEYVNEQIKKDNHDEFIKSLGNKISHEDFVNLQDIDNIKYLLMPSSYGMGKNTYVIRLDEMLSKEDKFFIWEKLNKKERKMISNYIWEYTEKILEELGFSIKKYKDLCNNFWKKEKWEVFVWKNDLGLILAPISFKNSDRDNILKKLNSLKLKKKEITDIEKIESIEKEEDFQKKKLTKNDREFWKRSWIETKNLRIFARIYYKEKYKIDAHLTRQSLIPNSIHAYDAAIMHLAINIFRKIDIKVLTIHDSIGANCLEMVMVKIVFKIVNIMLLDVNTKKRVFPFDKKRDKFWNNDEEFFKKIIKSKDFFR